MVVRGQNGFSLVEMMIVLGIVSIVAYGMSTLLTESFKNQSKIEQKDVMRIFQQELESMIKYNANCGISNIPMPVTNFNNTTSYSITSIDSPSSNVSATTPYGALTVSSLEISGHLNRSDKSVQYIGLDSGSVATDKHIQANIKVGAQSKALASQFINLPVRLILNDARTQIIGCQHLLAANSSMDIGLICGSMGGDWNPATEKCELPCPAGFHKDEDDIKCVADEASEDADESIHCAMAEACSPYTRFLGSEYD